VEKDMHLLALCRYIVLNPVKAGLSDSAESWKWSSYRATVGLRKPAYPLKVEWLLSMFGDVAQNARRSYAEFVGDDNPRMPDGSVWNDLKGQIYLGDDEFIHSHMRQEGSDENPRAQLNPLRPPLSSLLSQGGRPPEIEKALSEGYHLKEIGKHLGIHYTSVRQRLSRARAGRT